MKKSFTIFLALLLITMQPIMASDDVPLLPNPIVEGPGNRTPTTIPIQCYYSNGELTFTFSADLGTVDCEVIRLGLPDTSFVEHGTVSELQKIVGLDKESIIKAITI